MLRTGLSLLLIAALAGGPAEAAGKKPPAGTAQPDAADDDQDAPPGPPGQPKGPPQGFVSPQPQPQPRFVVLTEQQKRCGVQRRCVLDSRAPCPPCWQ